MLPKSSGPRSAIKPVSGVPQQEVHAQLDQVLASSGFAKSARLSRFLRVAVERTLAGQTESLKEFALGQDVFDRGAGYDPRTDSIVRVEAQRLRRKLAEYYEGDGRQARVLITLRPGNYVPAFRWRRPPEEPAHVPPTIALAPELDPNTVAVLPFVNLSPDPEQALFCNGTTEEIIHKLTAFSGLRVLGLTTVFALNASAEGVMASCQKLGVGTLIEGSVRQSGTRLRIAAKAVAVASGRALWSHRFDRQVGDIFSVQDEIAHAVAAALHAPAPPAAPASVHGLDLEAYGLYLKGWQTWDDTTRERCLSAIDHFKRSAFLAPDFVLPSAGLAHAYHWMALWGWMRPREAHAKSREAALQALRIDDRSADGHVAWAATLLRFDWDWKGAEAAAGKALALNPSCGLAHSILAGSLLAQSRFDEAMRSYEWAVQLDPLSYRTNGALGVGHWVMGSYREAEPWLRLSLELNPGSPLSQTFLVRLYLSMGRFAEAAKLCEETSQHSPTHLLLGAQASAYAGSGNRDEAVRILRRLERCLESEYVDRMAIAITQVALGDFNGALVSLGQALEERSPLAGFFHLDPSLLPLRADPRFQALVSSGGHATS